MRTADSFIYLWGLFFGCWLVCRIPVLFQSLVTEVAVVAHSGLLQTMRQSSLQHYGGRGGLNTAGRVLTTVNAMVIPGGNLL